MEENSSNGKLKKIIRSRKIFEILFAIQLLIFVGLLVLFFTTSAIKKEDTCNEQECEISKEVEEFNNKFIYYEGDEKTGTQVKYLLNEIKKNNEKATNVSEIIRVVKGKKNKNTENIEKISEADRDSASKLSQEIKAGYTYSVEFTKDEVTGKITICYIEKL